MRSNKLRVIKQYAILLNLAVKEMNILGIFRNTRRKLDERARYS